MGSRTKLTEQDKADIVARYRKGQSYRFIAYAMDRSNQTIKKVLHEAEVGIRQARYPVELEFIHRPKLKKAS